MILWPISRTPEWGVVAGAFLVLMSGFGAIYSYAAFAEEIARAFGVDRPAMALVFALSGGACFLVSAISGPLADRLGTRAVCAVGMLLISVGLAMAAKARTLMEVYIGYGLLTGLGVGFAYVPAMAAVQRAFLARRGLASGIAVSGIGIGTALVPPAAELLATFGDWRVAFLISGVAVALIGGAGAILLPATRAAERRGQTPAMPQARGFALAYLGTLLISMPAMLPHAALVGSARDIGLSRQDALALLGLLGTGTIAGRFLLAALADMMCRRRVFLACCATMAASMTIWATADGVWTLRGFALIFGAAQGGFVALLPVFIADRFGTTRLGHAMGLLYTSRGIALLAAPPVLMMAIDTIGLAAALLAFGTLGLVGALTLSRIVLSQWCDISVGQEGIEISSRVEIA